MERLVNQLGGGKCEGWDLLLNSYFAIQEEVGTGLIILLFGPCTQTHSHTYIHTLTETIINLQVWVHRCLLILAQVLSHWWQMEEKKKRCETGQKVKQQKDEMKQGDVQDTETVSSFLILLDLFGLRLFWSRSDSQRTGNPPWLLPHIFPVKGLMKALFGLIHTRPYCIWSDVIVSWTKWRRWHHVAL